MALAGDGDLLIATTTNGLIDLKNNSAVTIKPNGRSRIKFMNIAVDDNGSIWVGTGRDSHGTGFMKFDGRHGLILINPNTHFLRITIFTNLPSEPIIRNGLVRGEVELFRSTTKEILDYLTIPIPVFRDIRMMFLFLSVTLQPIIKEILDDRSARGRRQSIMGDAPDSTWSGYSAPLKLCHKRFKWPHIDENGNK